MINVLFFGPVAERVGKNQLHADFRPGLRLQDLRDELSARYAEAFALVSLAAANGGHARDFPLPLADGNEVVFMPKFSGG